MTLSRRTFVQAAAAITSFDAVNLAFAAVSDCIKLQLD